MSEQSEPDACTMSNRLGRPRDSEADARILEAALTLFGERGWHGMSMQEIARLAAVSKGLLYSRWTKVEDILTAAFDSIRRPPAPTEQTLREALIAEGHFLAEDFLGQHGSANIRLWIEGTVGPDFLRTYLDMRKRRDGAALRAIVGTAKQVGEIPPEASTTRMLDIMEGAMFAHTFVTPPEKRELMREEMEQYITDLVDDILWSANRPLEAPIYLD